MRPAPVRVRWRLHEGTAKRGRDFVPADLDGMERSVVIPPLSLSAPVRVRIKGDRWPELDEAFSVELLAPENASLADAGGTATILDDDGVSGPPWGR